jgi:hypothetical protein
VLIGVRADGGKELIALTDGYREASESWADLLRDAKRRGIRAARNLIGHARLRSSSHTLERRTTAGPSSALQCVLSGPPYSVSSHVRHVQVVWPTSARLGPNW